MFENKRGTGSDSQVWFCSHGTSCHLIGKEVSVADEKKQ